MTRKRLENLKALKNEIKLLQKELRELSRSRTLAAGGIDAVEAALSRPKLEAKLERLQVELAEIEEWMDNQEDSEMRTILRLRYGNGMSWQWIAVKMEHIGDGSTERKKCYKFLKSQKLS